MNAYSLLLATSGEWH